MPWLPVITRETHLNTQCHMDHRCPRAGRQPKKDPPLLNASRLHQALPGHQSAEEGRTLQERRVLAKPNSGWDHRVPVTATHQVRGETRVERRRRK